MYYLDLLSIYISDDKHASSTMYFLFYLSFYSFFVMFVSDFTQFFNSLKELFFK